MGFEHPRDVFNRRQPTPDRPAVPAIKEALGLRGVKTAQEFSEKPQRIWVDFRRGLEQPRPLLAGAIAKTAEETFNSFAPDEQRIVRRIMLRLTQLGEGTEDTRRRASIDELVTAPEEADAVERIVRAMVDSNLLTTSGE